MSDDTSTGSALRSGQLARMAGVSTDTLRHYERLGLIPEPARAANGYRQYPPRALDRVRLVRAALTLGFTLGELADVLAARDRGGAPCRRVRSLAAAKLELVEERLRELSATRDALRELIAEWDGRLTATPPGAPARLLESLAPNPPDGAPGVTARRSVRRLRS